MRATWEASMNISLPLDLEKVITEKMESGRYHTAIEVIAEAMHLLCERDERDQWKLEDLRCDLAAGIEQANREMVAPLNARETLARVRQTRVSVRDVP
jgi:antitoxin ParD1/3/4